MDDVRIETGLVYLLMLAFAATVPVWSYSRPWGDHPSELIGLALVAVLMRILLSRR
jgi:hypothetical protein